MRTESGGLPAGAVAGALAGRCAEMMDIIAAGTSSSVSDVRINVLLIFQISIGTYCTTNPYVGRGFSPASRRP